MNERQGGIRNDDNMWTLTNEEKYRALIREMN